MARRPKAGRYVLGGSIPLGRGRRAEGLKAARMCRRTQDPFDGPTSTLSDTYAAMFNSYGPENNEGQRVDLEDKTLLGGYPLGAVLRPVKPRRWRQLAAQAIAQGKRKLPGLYEVRPRIPAHVREAVASYLGLEINDPVPE